jgi:hypothetical protein
LADVTSTCRQASIDATRCRYSRKFISRIMHRSAL